eukprot:CAMPEP_0116894756 /NCGR_PEP_ID=MMETSP0467-20121206/4449_1 /TAXON_ID=283647 /ORGANISM="Mesodinium pulex, Strain SPMC105" /LENGTH=114 /DNA_ID=CAMNT_0004565143 /DNA_START=424 /DNA_END=767 /DNA_ORIENTATION=+
MWALAVEFAEVKEVLVVAEVGDQRVNHPALAQRVHLDLQPHLAQDAVALERADVDVEQLRGLDLFVELEELPVQFEALQHLAASVGLLPALHEHHLLLQAVQVEGDEVEQHALV